MATTAGSLEIQQLLELLAVVSSYPDERSAVQGAVERAALALEAEVAAVVFDDRVAASVGFPAGAVPAADLAAVARRERTHVTVPGLGSCRTTVAGWGGTRPGHLILARVGADSFTAQEHQLIRGMARLLELTLTMLRTLRAEHEMRERGERQAAENAQLLASLRQRQRLLEHLFDIQRAISRREPLPQILETITSAAQDLLGDEIVGLWLVEQHDPERARLHAASGLDPELAKRLPAVRLLEAGAAGAAILADDLVKLRRYEHASPVIGRLTHGDLHASIAAPVHESGRVTGSLLVASYRPDRVFGPADEQTLRAFAEHVSLALTDAKTVDLMQQAFHDSLTGLASRGLFLEKLSQHLADGHEGEQVALLFVDLDRFKSINDTLGHDVGDQLLMITADRIRSQLHPGDVAARLGGDEFAILLPGTAANATPAQAAISVAERLCRTLGESMVIAGCRLAVEASIGIAVSTPGRTETADLMRRADIAMYQAKRNGRGRYEVFTAEMLAAFAEAGGADPQSSAQAAAPQPA